MGLVKKKSEETRRRISEALIGHTVSPESRRKIGDASRGRKHSTESRRKISEVGLGKTRSLETRRRMSAAQMGRTPSDEARKKMSAAHLGHTLSPEHRQKLLKSNTGRPCSEETRRRISAGNKGKVRSAEVRRKLSVANKGKSPSLEALRRMSIANARKGRKTEPGDKGHGREEKVFYVYAYLRSRASRDGRWAASTPYYIGKGSGYRAFLKHHRSGIQPPKDRGRIVLLAQGLSEVDAHQAEMLLIFHHGRMDLGTGCLRNLTDGGEGTSGRVHITEAEFEKQCLAVEALRKEKTCSAMTREQITTWEENRRIERKRGTLTQRRISRIEKIPGWEWSPRSRPWRSFGEARDYVRALKLPGEEAWRIYLRSGIKPADIPAVPSEAYGAFWQGFGDWLGTGYIANHLRRYRSFTDARDFARSMGLRSKVGWDVFSKTQGKPEDIPAAPQIVYKGEWKGWGDWLGNGHETYHKSKGEFERVRGIFRSLNLKSSSRWFAFCASDMRPRDIPRYPPDVYAEYWAGWEDWLGNNGRALDKAKLQDSVHFAETLAKENGGALPSAGSIRRHHIPLSGYMQRHPKQFSHIPQEVLRKKDVPRQDAGVIVGFRNGTGSQRKALEIKHGLHPRSRKGYDGRAE